MLQYSQIIGKFVGGVEVPIIFVGLMILVFGVFHGETSIQDHTMLKESRDVLIQTVEKLTKETKDLEDEITKIRESPSYAKRVLKDKYHVIEEGERIIFFAD